MAFFLEASFLGVLLFGRRLVPTWAHFFAALMVAFGTLMSAFWILATNSWMQTPQGYKIVDGRFEPVDWAAIIFNPSFPYRLLHNVTAFYITTAFVVMGVGAWLLRRNRAADDARMMIRMALDLLILLVPLQIFLGDQHGLNTLEYQPAKVAAIEGRYDSVQPVAADFVWHSGRRDGDDARRDRDTSPWQSHSDPFLERRDQGAKGMAAGPAAAGRAAVFCLPSHGRHWRHNAGRCCDRSNIAAARTAMGLGWFLRLCQWVAPLGFVAVIAGWITTEVGRQPWTVYGLLRTADSVSPSLTGANVAWSLAFYVGRLSDHVPDRHRFHGRSRRAAVRSRPNLKRKRSRSRAADRTSRSKAPLARYRHPDEKRNGARSCTAVDRSSWARSVLLRGVRRLRPRRRNALRFRAG